MGSKKVLIIDKEEGLTSRDIVNKLVKKFNTNKIGHTGTLDPIATGVLVVCIGKATKIVELLTSMEKEYIAEVTLGVKTDTLDITGNVLDSKEVSISKETIQEVLSSFVGKYIQEVPIYSAVKVNGKKLYEYAREGKEIELPKREVEIKNIELIDTYIKDGRECFKLKCLVSKGTYIRSLIKDICDKLNTIGCMSSLRRTKQGKFSIDRSKKVEDITSSDVISLYDVLDIPKIAVDDYLYKKIINGQILENRYNSDLIMYIYDDQVLAIYQVKPDDKAHVKPYKMFGGIK